MSNVIALNTAAVEPAPSVFPTESKLYFDVIERPLEVVGRKGDNMRIDSHKALLRKHPEKNEAIDLAVVGSGYKVVQNKDLFTRIDQQFEQAFSPAELDGVQIKDSISYLGRTSMREYVFPNVRIDMPSRTQSDVAFRTIVVNGFGGSSVKILAGAIDFFCTNGMVTGEFDAMYRRHSSGLCVQEFSDRVKGAVDVFYKQADIWKNWHRKDITPAVAEDFFKALPNVSERKAAQLFRQYLIEAQVRGNNVWSLYSALTYYATHNEGDFKIRNTGSDHLSATLLKREEQVKRWIDAPVFAELLAA